MWKLTKAPTTNLFIQIALTLFILTILLLGDTANGLSDKRLCADEECKNIISLGRGKINYRAGAEGMVSFKINSPIRIKSKSAGTDLSLWGIEVNGREGYAPKTLIREEKIVVPDKDLKYIVDVVDPSISPPVVEPTVLNSSSESIVEATSTKPLEAVSTDSQGEAVVKSPGENAGNVSPQTATPVQEDTIVVDGTRLPALHEPSDTVAASKDNEEQLQQASSTSTMSADSDDDGGDDEDDGDIGDYDDDEDEENSEEVVSTKMMQMESVPLNVSTDNNLDKSQETSEDVMKNGVEEEKENIVVEDVKNDTIDVAVEATTSSPVVIENDSSEGAVEIIDSVAESLPLPVETSTVTSIPESTITHNSSDTLAPEGVEQPHDDHQQQVPKDDEKTENSVIDNTVVNTINEVASPTANEEGHLVDNNISNEPSLPDNNIHDGLITDTLLPIANSSETHESVQVEIPVSDNIELLEPTNTVQSGSPTVTSDLPIVNHASQSHETEQPSHQNWYLDPTQTEGVQINSETIQTSVQTESPVLNSEIQTEAPHHHNDPYHHNTNDHVEPSRFNPYDNVESSNTPLPPQYDFNNPTESSITDAPPHSDYYGQPPAGYLPTETVQEDTTLKPPYIATTDVPIVSQPEPATDVPQVQIPDSPYREEISYGQGIVEPLQPLVTPEPPTPKEDDEPKTLPSLTPSFSAEEVEKKDKGLFATIMDTVNNILPNNKKAKLPSHEIDDTDELNKILYPGQHSHLGHHATKEESTQFCEKIGSHDCPHAAKNQKPPSDECVCSLKSLITTEFTIETFAQALASKVLEISDLLAFLTIVAAATLFFIFGYYCFCNSSGEGALLSKLNQLESSLLASHKENAILKHNLMSTRQKLVSIEDNSFGSNDMVVSIKKELEEELVEKARLQEQITSLQKELENAADAGIELNKIVSELLSNQTGDENIISSVEELQKQLNEQQNIILEINASLAEKSRENSELQLLIAEQNARYEGEISNLQRDNDELETEKGNLRTRLEEMKTDFDKDITAALEGKNFEIKRLQNEIVDLSTKLEAEHTKWQTSMAKVEALEECLKNVKRDPNVNITQVIDAANIRAELLDAQKKYTALKERLELELDARKLSENQLQLVTAEVEKLKQDFNQSEKDKLEAQTRLEVLSNYFKDKETQLQKELSLKETMWLQQQGETTTTVDRLTTMQEEIQSLKSQNDSLRAEIEAQVAAHKAQTGTLENRAHETWLAARQSDRRYEEARAEATALRRKLTALAGGNVNEASKSSAGPAGMVDELTNAPSPIHMESPGSPMLGRMPPPPFLPPPFMGPPPPFMGMPPPPPFVPPGEMRPAPLGRIMSPPPPQRSSLIEYDDYMDYEGNNSWHRHHTYSPPPRTYRSLSPTDSRYNYGTERDLMSTYDTETDFSPPPSPRESRRRGGYDSDRGGGRNPYNKAKNSSSGPKGASSGSDKSYNSSSKPGPGGSKSKTSGGGKSLV